MDEAEYEDLLEEARLMTEPEEESVFSDSPDWYLRMCEDQRKGFADYE